MGEMNRVAAACGATRTSLVSPHGMGHEDNVCSARDVVHITVAALRHPVVASVVATQAHVGSAIGTRFGRTVVLKKFKWRNTNALLTAFPSEYSGVKTGWVPNAHGQAIHACLASRVAVTPERRLFCVVVGSTSKPGRFIDTHQLVTWARGLPLKALAPVDAGRVATGGGGGAGGAGAPAAAATGSVPATGGSDQRDSDASESPSQAKRGQTWAREVVDPASVGVHVGVRRDSDSDA